MPARQHSVDSVTIPVIQVTGVSKVFPIFAQPGDRLKQFLLPRLQRALGLPPQRYYSEFHAVREVSLTVKRGEAWGIVGRNGSGKSTLLQVIAGTLEATSGTVETHGRVAALLELGSGFNPEFTGRENIMLNGSILGLDAAKLTARLPDILAFADIGEFIDRPLKTYSNGMAVRLAFAVAVCIEPDVLIVDEALAVGDAGFQFKCLARIRQLRERGMTLLLVSHDLGMVKTFCDRALYLRKGEVVMSGSPLDVAEVYLRDIRAEQRLASGMNAGGPVVAKPALKGAKASFGTQQGEITRACFVPSGATSELFTTGSEIIVRVEYRHDLTVTRPRLALIIQEQKHILVAGRHLHTSETGTATSLNQQAAVRIAEFRFKARLGGGKYFVTLILEDCRDEREDLSLLIDKQAALLDFEIIPDAEDRFLGLFDLAIEAREVAMGEAGDV